MFALNIGISATSARHNRTQTHTPRREVTHAITSHSVWYKSSGRPLHYPMSQEHPRENSRRSPPPRASYGNQIGSPQDRKRRALELQHFRRTSHRRLCHIPPAHPCHCRRRGGHPRKSHQTPAKLFLQGDRRPALREIAAGFLVGSHRLTLRSPPCDSPPATALDPRGGSTTWPGFGPISLGPALAIASRGT